MALMLELALHEAYRKPLEHSIGAMQEATGTQH